MHKKDRVFFLFCNSVALFEVEQAGVRLILSIMVVKHEAGPPGQMLCSSEEVLNGYPLLFVAMVAVLTSDSKLFGQ